jgi:hypothetical protein
MQYRSALLLDGQGHLYFGGAFDEIDNHPIGYLAKLATDGAGDIDATWNPAPANDYLTGVTDYLGAGWLPPVRALAMWGNGAILVGGDFSGIGGELRNGLAAIPPAPLPDNIMTNGFELQ